MTNKTMQRKLLKNATILNEGEQFRGYIVVEDNIIAEVGHGDSPADESIYNIVVDLKGKFLLPGVIDTHVHFRDPGLTQKADMATESAAAVIGGVTSFIDMPNTIPATISINAWEEKMKIAEQKSVANYAFFIGATNSNLNELLQADYSRVPGVKLFLGSSTGNMLVDSNNALDALFESMKNHIIAVHAESESVIQANRTKLLEEYNGASIPVDRHSDIRSRQACIEATSRALELAQRHDSRMHLLHISTADELDMLPHNGRVTAETCPHYLWFDNTDYTHLGARIKCNPAIKNSADRSALVQAVANGEIDVIATDHAPHLPTDKMGDALHAASGMPGIQYSLAVMLEIASLNNIPATQIVELMCHAPARLYGIEGRGFLRPGYAADITVVEQTPSYTITDNTAAGKCGWTPYAGLQLSWRVASTYVNGTEVFNGTEVDATKHGVPLHFCC